MCSGDTTPTNRLTRHESHLAAVEEHVPSQTHDKPVWLARKGRGRVFLLKYFTIPPRSSFPETEETRSGSRELASPPYAATCSSFVVIITGQARSRLVNGVNNV